MLLFYRSTSSFSDPAGFSPAAVPPGVGRVWQSSAPLSPGAAGGGLGVAAAVAGVLARRAPGQAASLLLLLLLLCF